MFNVPTVDTTRMYNIEPDLFVSSLTPTGQLVLYILFFFLLILYNFFFLISSSPKYQPTVSTPFWDDSPDRVKLNHKELLHQHDTSTSKFWTKLFTGLRVDHQGEELSTVWGPALQILKRGKPLLHVVLALCQTHKMQ